MIKKNAREVLEHGKSGQGENPRYNQSGFEPGHQGRVRVGQQADHRQKTVIRVIRATSERWSDHLSQKQSIFPDQLFKPYTA